MVYLSGAGLPRLSYKKTVKCMYVSMYYTITETASKIELHTQFAAVNKI